jgi:hypothetical protein
MYAQSRNERLVKIRVMVGEYAHGTRGQRSNNEHSRRSFARLIQPGHTELIQMVPSVDPRDVTKLKTLLSDSREDSPEEDALSFGCYEWWSPDLLVASHSSPRLCWPRSFCLDYPKKRVLVNDSHK